MKAVCFALCHSPRGGPGLRVYAEGVRYVGESGLFGITHLNAADTEETTFLRRLGDLLAYSTEPSLKGSRIARRLGKGRS